MFLEKYFLPEFDADEIELQIRYKALVAILGFLIGIVLLAAMIRYGQGYMVQAMMDVALALIFVASWGILKKYKQSYKYMSRGILILSLIVLISGLYVGGVLILSLAAYVMTLFMMMLFIQEPKERIIWFILYFGVYLIFLHAFYKNDLSIFLGIAIGVGIAAIVLIAYTHQLLIIASKEHQAKIYDEKRTALLGNMVSMIAHQWRQPLATINATIANLQLSAHINEDLELNEVLKELNSISDRTSELSKTLTLFTSIFVEHASKEVVMPRDLINKSLDEFIWQGIPMEIKHDVSVETEKAVMVNIENIKVALWIILENAYDQFKTMAGIEARIELKAYDQEDRIILSVFSNTPLIKTVSKVQIFDPYFSTKEDRNGVGLGLYIAKTLVEKNGGKLWCENQEDGVVFFMLLPAETQ